MPAALRPLRHRDFRLLWAGLAVSLTGSGLWLVALAWQVISLGGGPAQLSVVTALYGVGLLAFLLVAGVAPVLLAVAAILIPRLDRDEIAHPLDHPTTREPEATGRSTKSPVR